MDMIYRCYSRSDYSEQGYMGKSPDLLLFAQPYKHNTLQTQLFHKYTEP